MSAAVAAESCFLSALQPNSTVTTYAVPSDMQIGADGSLTDAVAKARRVQQQVQMRLAEKNKSSSMPRLNGTLCGPGPDHYVSPVRSFASSHAGFSSRSMIHTPSRVMSVATAPLRAGGFSSRSAVENGTSRYKMSQSGASIATSSYQTSQSHGRSNRSKSLSHDQEGIPLSLLTNVPCDSPAYHTLNLAPTTMHRSLSGTLARRAGLAGWRDDELAYQQQTFRGPSHRTISRITNRQQVQQQQQQQQLMNSSWGQGTWAGGMPGYVAGAGGWAGGSVSAAGQYQASLRRAASLRSMKSVGKGMDVLDAGGESTHSNEGLGGIQSLDMPTAVSYLSQSDSAMQVLGAAYIQHQCYHSNDAKNQVRTLRGVPALVQLFSSENQEVQRFSTGATRNLIYENADNKAALIEAGGVTQLVSVLKEPDEELRKNITGILWNLSSRDNLKEKLSREALSELTERVLVPLCQAGDSGSISLSPSEKDIFYNTTGCLRNLSSVNERTRQMMREMRGLVDSLVAYVQSSVQEERSEDKGVENAVCVLRNLSYQLYVELPPSALLRLEGPTRNSAKPSQAISCFTPQSKKVKERRNQELLVFSEVSRQPKGAEWLWHPLVVGLYKGVLQNSNTSSATREAAAGALQNITAGDARWASVLSRVALEQDRMLPVLLDLLDTHSDMELRPLTGLLGNLARHAHNKDHMATKSVNVLVSRLPSDGLQKEPSSEVVVNICGALNYLVTGSSLAARDISYFNGLPKLVGIKTSHDNSSGRLKAAKAASTVLCNMFQYNKLHREYKQKGFSRQDFTG